MSTKHKTLITRIEEYVKYCISKEFIEEYLYETEEMEVPKINLHNRNYLNDLKGLREIIQETIDSAAICLDKTEDLQYDVLQQVIFDYYKNDQSKYEAFLTTQFNQAFLDQDKNLHRLYLLFNAYYHLAYSKSLVFKALDSLISKKLTIEPYRYIILLGIVVEILIKDKKVEALTTQHYLRKVAYQIPNKEDYQPNHTRYLSNTLANLDTNLKENQAVFEFWINQKQFPDIAEIAQEKLRE